MGGQSFKCPECNRWFLSKGDLSAHLKGKHDYKPHFVIVGVASLTKVEKLNG